MKIHADTEICASAGMCVLTAPEVFDQDEDDGRVLLLQAVPESEHEDAARESVMLCPSGALSLEED